MAIVQRAPADKPGEDIVSSVLLTAATQIERGRQEINYNSTDRVMRTVGLVTVEFIAPGKYVSVVNSEGASVGKVTDFSIRINRNSMSSELSIEGLL